MKDSIRRVIMSKKVAAKYIDSVAQAGRTLTVYFSDNRVMNSFLKEVKTASYRDSISVCEGFDHVTFLSTNKEAIQDVSKKANKAGLDTSEM